MIYLIGSLRNPNIPLIGARLRNAGFEVFDDWFAGGPIADDSWMEYEKLRGHDFDVALEGIAANHIFNFDKRWLDTATSGLLVLPAGRSGHLELGYLIGQGKPGYILLDNPDRWDVMYRFATRVSYNIDTLITELNHSWEAKVR